MADIEAPAYFQISPQNRSPWVVVTSVVFLIYSILAVITKIVSRVHLTAMKSYDHLIIVSTLAALVETILVIAACRAGLGQHEAALSSDQLRRYNHASSIFTPTEQNGLIPQPRTPTQLPYCLSCPMHSRKFQLFSSLSKSPLNGRFAWHATHCLPSSPPGPLALSSP